MWGHVPIVNHKYIYARNASVLGNDDDSISSVIFPVSALRGLFFQSSAAIIMSYESPYQYVGNDNDNCDTLVLSIPSNQHKTFMTELVREITFGDSAVIVIRDNLADTGFDGITTIAISSNTGAD